MISVKNSETAGKGRLGSLLRSNKLILLSVVLALVLGVLKPEIFAPIQGIGIVFMNLLKAFAVPLICSSLIVALGGFGSNLSQLRGAAARVVSYMLVSEIAAVFIAILLFNVFKPGVGLTSDMLFVDKTVGEAAAATPLSLNLGSFLLSVCPQNIFESLVKFELLPVVLFSIMIGVGCNFVDGKAKPLVDLARSIQEVCSVCLHFVMLLCPLAIFSLVGFAISQANARGNLRADLMALLSFVVVLCLGLLLQGLWQLVMVVVTTRQSFKDVLRKSIPVFATAFGTSSSMATLPVAMKTADDLKSDPATTRFMLPLCASINVGGMMMYEVAAALFFSQMLGIELSLVQQMEIAFVCILGGMAEGGIPESSMMSLLVVFKMVNVPASAISILLPLDRLVDRLRTMVNIFGNMCGAILVSHFSQKSRSIQLEAGGPISSDLKLARTVLPPRP